VVHPRFRYSAGVFSAKRLALKSLLRRLDFSKIKVFLVLPFILSDGFTHARAHHAAVRKRGCVGTRIAGRLERTQRMHICIKLH
jgi:hypothetical protein